MDSNIDIKLREICEKLRSRPINDAWPAEKVPCNETSDPDKLCHSPLVSVHMTVYNHENYLKDSIEGVLSQETDFEYELIIGEDASTDTSRKICFEYQKKHPDKIRVLWSEKNVNAADGNWTRISANCRGEYVAFCEGDDFWTDTHKLQKQVDAMRAHPSAGLCFTRAIVFEEKTGAKRIWNGDGFPEGLIPGKRFYMLYAFGDHPYMRRLQTTTFIMTPTVMVKNSVLQEAIRRFDAFRWALTVGDAKVALGCSALSDALFMYDVTATYRHNPGGISVKASTWVDRDSLLLRLYFTVVTGFASLKESLAAMNNFFAFGYMNELLAYNRNDQKKRAREFLQEKIVCDIFKPFWCRIAKRFMLAGFVTPKSARILGILIRFGSIRPPLKSLSKIYKEFT